MYDNDLNDTNSCYQSSLGIGVNELKRRQEEFILSTLEEIKKTYNINNVVFFAHEPLIIFKNKNGKKKSSTNSQLLEILFEEKKKYKNIGFYWICADYHIYQNSVITDKSLPPGQQITQWIFGTGGGKLDKPPSSNIFKDDKYKLEILPNKVFNSAGEDISQQFNANGVDKFGYGEISFDFCSITHKFILAEHIYEGGDNDYKSKYLKYKLKYIELKKLTNY